MKRKIAKSDGDWIEPPERERRNRRKVQSWLDKHPEVKVTAGQILDGLYSYFDSSREAKRGFPDLLAAAAAGLAKHPGCEINSYEQLWAVISDPDALARPVAKMEDAQSLLESYLSMRTGIRRMMLQQLAAHPEMRADYPDMLADVEAALDSFQGRKIESVEAFAAAVSEARDMRLADLRLARSRR